MNETRVTRKRRIWLSVLVAFIVAYGATWLFGVRAVKARHREELQHFYEKQKRYYDDNKDDLDGNVFWMDMLGQYNGFPSWQEYQLWKALEQNDQYYAIFPLVVLSWREHRGNVPGSGLGTNEYHIWYLLNTSMVAEQLRWIE